MRLLTSRDFQSELDKFILTHSGHESGRSYLGMSQINKPRVELVEALLAGGAPEVDEVPYHEQMRMGYLFEEEIKGRFKQLGMLRSPLNQSIELVAKFDDRFRGHADGELIDGSVLEIKSLADAAALATIRESGRLRASDFAQTQMYLHHGEYEQAVLVYIVRTTGTTWATTRRPDPVAAASLNAKAQSILAEYDRRRTGQPL